MQASALNVIWTDLDRIDIEPGVTVLTLDLDDVNLTGDEQQNTGSS